MKFVTLKSDLDVEKTSCITTKSDIGIHQTLANLLKKDPAQLQLKV
jgi:hypothetical protein